MYSISCGISHMLIKTFFIHRWKRWHFIRKWIKSQNVGVKFQVQNVPKLWHRAFSESFFSHGISQIYIVNYFLMFIDFVFFQPTGSIHWTSLQKHFGCFETSLNEYSRSWAPQGFGMKLQMRLHSTVGVTSFKIH